MRMILTAASKPSVAGTPVKDPTFPLLPKMRTAIDSDWHPKGDLWVLADPALSCVCGPADDFALIRRGGCQDLRPEVRNFDRDCFYRLAFSSQRR
jgi:hypothetical protein